MAVIDNIIDGAVRKTSEGLTASRTFVVTDVTGDPPGRMLSVLGEAGIPDYGDAHPANSDITVTEIAVSPQAGDPSIFVVEVQYGPAPLFAAALEAPGQWGNVYITASADTVETEKDHAGNDMVIQWTGYGFAGFGTYTKTVKVEIPSGGYTFSVDYVVAGGGVATLVNTYSGAVNAVAWNGPARTWLCTEPFARQIEGTANYLVRMSFRRRIETWDHVEFVHPSNILGSPDLSVDGTATFRVFREVDFSPLPFVLP